MNRIITVFFLLACASGRAQTADSTDSKTSGKWETFPCPTDTLKGILIWHSSAGFNSGDSWDYGYWIGKCGPSGSMPLEGLIFVPGVQKITRFARNGGEKHWHKEEVEYVNEGFRDSKFLPISGRRVYAFIIIRNP